MDCCRQDWAKAANHLERSCGTTAANHRARNLRAMIARKQGDSGRAGALAKLNKATDPLDWWARYLLGEKLPCDTQTLLDLALDLARAGFCAEAIELLRARVSDYAKGRASEDPRELGTAPLVHFYLGWLHAKWGEAKAAIAEFKKGATAPPDYCFPARLEEIAIFESAMAANPKDARAPYYLGNLLYDRRRHAEAIGLWEKSARLDPTFSVVWRNLGIGCFNIRHNARQARSAYDRAFRANPNDARLLFERDQLWKRLGEKPARRLRELEARLDLVR
jgi:tetratricopeptide (TPR) repeat protein